MCSNCPEVPLCGIDSPIKRVETTIALRNILREFRFYGKYDCGLPPHGKNWPAPDCTETEIISILKRLNICAPKVLKRILLSAEFQEFCRYMPVDSCKCKSSAPEIPRSGVCCNVCDREKLFLNLLRVIVQEECCAKEDNRLFSKDWVHELSDRYRAIVTDCKCTRTLTPDKEKDENKINAGCIKMSPCPFWDPKNKIYFGCCDRDGNPYAYRIKTAEGKSYKNNQVLPQYPKPRNTAGKALEHFDGHKMHKCNKRTKFAKNRATEN